MAKKRKVVDAAAAPVAALEEAEPPRKRTLLGRKENGHHQTDDEGANKPVFRNKEKVLVLCSRRITFRFATPLLVFPVLCIYRVINALTWTF
jgi:ribosome biogenesis protein BRX1